MLWYPNYVHKFNLVALGDESYLHALQKYCPYAIGVARYTVTVRDDFGTTGK